MKRFGAHFIYCNPTRIIAKGVVEVDDQGSISRLFSLNEYPEEIHSTIFYNGILIPPLLEQDTLKNFFHQPVFQVLDRVYGTRPYKLEEQRAAHIYLLEELNLVDKIILPESTLIKLL